MEKFTNTPEGKEILDTLEYTIGTKGMEVYRCDRCEELFAGKPELVEDEDEAPECGICTMEREAIRRMEYPNEHEYEYDPELDGE